MCTDARLRRVCLGLVRVRRIGAKLQSSRQGGSGLDLSNLDLDLVLNDILLYAQK